MLYCCLRTGSLSLASNTSSFNECLLASCWQEAPDRFLGVMLYVSPGNTWTSFLRTKKHVDLHSVCHDAGDERADSVNCHRAPSKTRFSLQNGTELAEIYATLKQEERVGKA